MIERHSLAGTTAAHLIPGGLALLFYVPASRVAAGRGWPAPLALFLTMLLVLIPYELAVLLRARKKASSSAEMPAVVPYARRLSALEYVVLVPPMLAWAFFCFFAIAPHEERLVSEHVSPWLPAWLRLPRPVWSLARRARGSPRCSSGSW